MLSKTTKNRFGYKLDKFFWFFLALLPLLSWLCYLFSLPGTDFSPSEKPITLAAWMAQYFFGVSVTGNIFYSTLSQIFGGSGLFPLMSENFLQLVTYFCTIEVVHVMFDILVFIPRLAHKWISKAVQDD
jgi:hypothetical protein